MPARTARRLGPMLGLAGAVLLTSAAPAAAHSAGGGALPAPSWLLGYGGVAMVLITAVVLRSSWPVARLDRFHPADATPPASGPVLGGLVGIALLTLVFVTSLAGPNSGAANVAPWAVTVVFWIGLPLLCVLLGDVFRWISPFVTLLRLVDRRPRDDEIATAPIWIPAAFLFSFVWYFEAYYRPGAPRALAAYLAAYCVVAVGLGLRWGRVWMATGDGFGALSAGVARLSPRGAKGPLPRGLAPLMVVWLGGTAFDVLTQSTFWVEVLGVSRGWGRTLLNTVGLTWMTAVVAGVYLLVVRMAERGQADLRLAAPLGVALVPLAAGWFLAHDLNLFLAEGQNAYILMSDPFGKGWDLFGTINHTIDYGIVQKAWLRWTQIALLALGHIVALVALHDTALHLLPRRAAARATATMAVTLSASVVVGAMLVLH